MDTRELRCPNCQCVMTLARIEHRNGVPVAIVHECSFCRIFISEPLDEGAERRRLQ
jgi:hypothetical protein